MGDHQLFPIQHEKNKRSNKMENSGAVSRDQETRDGMTLIKPFTRRRVNVLSCNSLHSGGPCLNIFNRQSRC
jgi:hypothetical protein